MTRVLRWVATPPHLLCLVAALGILCYWPVLWGMASQWYFDQDMGHGFLVPVAAGWIAWQQRQRLAVARPSAWGLVFVLAGAALQLAGAVGAGLFVGSLGFVCALLGILLAAGGWPWLRELSFPLFLVVFMLPKLQFVYNQVTLPLQLLASQLAAALAHVTGTSVLREGNILQVAGHRIAVEEACNGIRYLLSLAFVSLLWGHMAGLRGWRRALLGMCAVPLAILVNALRVAAVAVMCRYNYPLAVGAFHDASGWAALALALALLVVAERAIRLLPAGAPRPEPPPDPAPARPFWLLGAGLILAVQLPLMHSVPLMETAPRVPALALFPEQLGAWRMTHSGALAADEAAILKADDTLLRYYADPGGAGEIELRVAYYGSERGGLRQPHSPKVCLPAGGWMPTESRIVPVAGGEVNLYQVAKGDQRATLLYWYQTPYQTTASEWTMKALVVENGILHHRTDVALVRLVGAPDAALAFAPLVMSEMQARLGPHAPRARPAHGLGRRLGAPCMVVEGQAMRISCDRRRDGQAAGDLVPDAWLAAPEHPVPIPVDGEIGVTGPPELWLNETVGPVVSRHGAAPMETRAVGEMVPYHEVKQGDSMASIADVYGFFWDTLWNHPNNEALRQLRQSPNVLMARDRVFVPDPNPKEEPGETTKVHTFRLKGVPIRLNFRLLDEEDQPRSGLPYTLAVDGAQVAAGVTPDDGLISAVISSKAKTAKLVVHAEGEDETHIFDVGHLNPIEYASGVQARLMNLGLYKGDLTGQIDEATKEAICMFQELEGLPVTGQPDDATKQALLQRHDI